MSTTTNALISSGKCLVDVYDMLKKKVIRTIGIFSHQTLCMTSSKGTWSASKETKAWAVTMERACKKEGPCALLYELHTCPVAQLNPVASPLLNLASKNGSVAIVKEAVDGSRPGQLCQTSIRRRDGEEVGGSCQNKVLSWISRHLQQLWLSTNPHTSESLQHKDTTPDIDFIYWCMINTHLYTCLHACEYTHTHKHTPTAKQTTHALMHTHTYTLHKL